MSRCRDAGHVRVSASDETGTARAAVSVEEAEARRLADHLRLGARPRRSRRFSLRR